MLAYKAYSQQQQPTNWARIDLLLALYDGAITRLERALAALRSGDVTTARPILARVQAIVLELAAGINFDAGDPSSANLMRLYEFFAQALAGTEVRALESVLKSLTTLREGFAAVRVEAVQLERGGVIPSVDAPRHVLALG